jgi:hypothetical protein
MLLIYYNSDLMSSPFLKNITGGGGKLLMVDEVDALGTSTIWSACS